MPSDAIVARAQDLRLVVSNTGRSAQKLLIGLIFASSLRSNAADGPKTSVASRECSTERFQAREESDTESDTENRPQVAREQRTPD